MPCQFSTDFSEFGVPRPVVIYDRDFITFDLEGPLVLLAATLSVTGIHSLSAIIHSSVCKPRYAGRLSTQYPCCKLVGKSRFTSCR